MRKIHTKLVEKQKYNIEPQVFDFGAIASAMKTIEDESIPSSVFQLSYAIRFELVFAAGIIVLYITGFFGNKRPKDSSFTRSAAGKGLAKWKKASAEKEKPLVKAAADAPPATEQFNETPIPRRTSSVRFSVDHGCSDEDGAKDINLLMNSRPDASYLRDSSWLFPRLIQLCTAHAQRAFWLYQSALEVGLDISQVPAEELDQLVMAFLTSMIRMGLLPEAMRLLRHLSCCGVKISQTVHSSAIKLCTAKHCFHECIEMHDLLVQLTSPAPVDKSIWSCLLFCGVESQQYNRCSVFVDKLKETGSPSEKDYLNMIRLGSAHGDWQMTFNLMEEMRQQELEIDSIIYNTVLATCVWADEVEKAKQLLCEMDRVGCVIDVVSYNTLIKGYATNGKVDACFELYDQMSARGLQASQVTFGILLDGCINNHQMGRATKLFDKMLETGCKLNTVIYTTLIKGFTREGKMNEAMCVYRQMVQDKDIVPDLITFAILLKANCDEGRLEAALELLDAMLSLGLKPDEVIFNNLLSGCAKNGSYELAKHVYENMLKSGIKPSNATFSILIRVYSQCKLFEDAVETLRSQPKLHAVELEPRIFTQLIQCCIRARHGRWVVEVYELMLEHFMPTTAMHSNMLGMCLKLNMFETASELLEIAAKRQALVDVRDALMVLEGARRKRKTVCARSVEASMQALGLDAKQPVLLSPADLEPEK